MTASFSKLQPLQLLDEMPQLAWCADPEGIITYANRRCHEFSGLDILAQTNGGWAQLIHPEDLAFVGRMWRQALEGKTIFDCEYRLRSADGEYRWFLTRVVPVRDENGNVTSWLGSATDIHKMKHVEEELRLTREQIEQERMQLKLALETAELGTCVVDWPSGDVEWDAQHAKIFGYPARAMRVTMRDFAGRLHPEIRDKVLHDLNEVVATRQHLYEGEWRLQLALSDEVRYIRNVTRFEYEKDGRCVRAQGLISDVTAQKTANEKLMNATRESDIANRAKSQFLANMSHEIRTPVGVVLGYTDLALESPHLDSETRAYLQAARNNGEALKKLIGDLLDLSKIESDKMDLEQIGFDLPHLIEDVVSSLQVRAREKSLQLRVEIQPQMTRRVIADPTAIRQILTNLISNSIKFTPYGGVHLSALEEKTADGRLRIRFRIRDTGIGVEEKSIPRLFLPFSQADSSMSRKYSGTGLGLVISRKLARLMEGDVALLETSQGRGSLFEFSLLCRPAPQEEDKPKGEVQPSLVCPLEGYRVLVVEDSVDNRDLLALYLTRAGALVEVAEDGLRGVHKALQFNPDAVLMDIQMPDMDGYEAYRQLRSSRFEKPVIALTAHALKSERDRALNAGFTSYLTKPIDRNTLVTTLAGLIRSQQLH
ncbi:MAG: PAS domain-containing protein [Bdellovibrionaceae bacterium]|nr:PAS domain-containing protein [Pseudobdellovibrionaceae bacterium]